jgi:hypothetical protein
VRPRLTRLRLPTSCSMRPAPRLKPRKPCAASPQRTMTLLVSSSSQGQLRPVGGVTQGEVLSLCLQDQRALRLGSRSTPRSLAGSHQPGSSCMTRTISMIWEQVLYTLNRPSALWER